MNCGAVKEAEILKSANKLNLDNYNHYIQLEKLEKQTALYNDCDNFWESVRKYIDKHK